MESLKNLIFNHAPLAHYYTFAALILAGFSIPISADVVILLAALLAATVIPENTWWLFSSILIGCYLSAMCAYWMGRALGTSSLLTRLVSPARLQTMKTFYEKYGLWTFLIGRFIPFGVRNCLFMSSGMSRMSFGKFILIDALACSLWCSSAFYLFFTIGKNYETLWHTLKTFNLCIFSVFGVAVISYIWYKLRKKRKAADPTKDLT